MNRINKTTKYVLSFIIAFFIGITMVNAQSCDYKEKNELRKLANKIEISPYMNTEFDPSHTYTYKLYITNLSDKFYIQDDLNNTYNYDKNYSSDKLYGNYYQGSTVTFKIMPTSGNCYGESLKTIKIKFNYYNDYSTREECKGIENFELCKRSYSGKIESEEEFLKKVEEYKNSKKEKPEKEQKKEKKFEINNVIMAAIGTVAIMIIFLVVVYAKNKEKIKINFDGKE